MQNLHGPKEPVKEPGGDLAAERTVIVVVAEEERRIRMAAVVGAAKAKARTSRATIVARRGTSSQIASRRMKTAENMELSAIFKSNASRLKTRRIEEVRAVAEREVARHHGDTLKRGNSTTSTRRGTFAR